MSAQKTQTKLQSDRGVSRRESRETWRRFKLSQAKFTTGYGGGEATTGFTALTNYNKLLTNGTGTRAGRLRGSWE